MTQGDKKLFKDKEKLYIAVNLRISGWAFTSIALHLNCHRTSLESQFKKYDIKPLSESTYTIERIASNVLKSRENPEARKWMIAEGDRVSVRKSYADYLTETSQYPHRKLSA